MVLFACSTAQEKAFFPEKALKDTLLTFDGVEKTVEEVLSQFKGKLWSWTFGPLGVEIVSRACPK